MGARATALLLAILSTGCGDSAAPAASSFTARIGGARTLTLSGASNAGPIATEERPELQFSIRMFDERADTVRAISIFCPGEQPPAPGQHPIGVETDVCAARYVWTVTAEPSIGGFAVIESAEASSGRVTISGVSGDQVEGSFSFTGALRAGADSIGTITASGSFSAQVP